MLKPVIPNCSNKARTVSPMNKPAVQPIKTASAIHRSFVNTRPTSKPSNFAIAVKTTNNPFIIVTKLIIKQSDEALRIFMEKSNLFTESIAFFFKIAYIRKGDSDEKILLFSLPTRGNAV